MRYNVHDKQHSIKRRSGRFLPRKDAQHPSTPKAAFYSYRAMLPLHRRRPRFVEAEKVVYRRGDGAQKK